MSVSQRAHLSAHVPFPYARGPHGPGTACRTILTNSTGRTVYGSWRINPLYFPNVRSVGVRYHCGASGTSATSLKIPAQGGIQDHTDDAATLL